MDLKTLVDDYLNIVEYQNNLDKKTIKAYRIDLSQFQSFVEDKDFSNTKEGIVNYIQFLNTNGYKIKTVKRKIASLKAFFTYLNCEDIIDINPFHNIKLKLKEPFILPKMIPLEVIIELFEYVYSTKKKIRKEAYLYKAIVRDIAVLELLFGTGIRISELCNLKRENIIFSQNIIKIHGKGNKERVIPIFHENILEALKLYEKNFYDISIGKDYFFINRNKNILSSQSVRNMINKYCRDANIKLHITPHMFRHTFATTLLDSDVDTRYIQQLLGHSSILTTQIYTHVTSNKKVEIMKYKNPRSKIIMNEG